MPLFIEPMLLKGTQFAISLVFTLTVDTVSLEEVDVKLFFFCLQSQRVDLKVCLVIPHYVPVMLDFVRSIAFDTFSTMHLVHECHMSSFPAVLIMWDTQIHVCSTNDGNVAFYIKIPVNKSFSL